MICFPQPFRKLTTFFFIINYYFQGCNIYLCYVRTCYCDITYNLLLLWLRTRGKECWRNINYTVLV